MQKIDCAEKNCGCNMNLTENTENFLYYNCIENHDEHVFRYNILNKKWEKISTRTKLVLNYYKNPLEVQEIKIRNSINKSERKPTKDRIKAKISKLSEIKGIGSKRAEQLELAGVKTVSDLAKRSPKHLSEKTGISIQQICTWIIKASNLPTN